MAVASIEHKQICISPQTATPAAHHSVFYTPDALPVAQPTASKMKTINKTTIDF